MHSAASCFGVSLEGADACSVDMTRGWRCLRGQVLSNSRPRGAVPARLARMDQITEQMQSPRVRAPEFPDALDWVHTGGRRLTLADFRGKVLLLDFWT